MTIVDQLMEPLQKGSRPNFLTQEMGESISIAHEDMGLSQRELAKMVFRRQAALPEIENGLIGPDAEILLFLSLRLRKPIAFFFKKYKKKLESGDLSDFEEELIIQTRKLSDEEIKINLVQTKALVDLSYGK